MTDLAAVGVDGWLHAFRPSPPRLENETSDREAFKPNYFNPRFARGPDLVRFVVRFGFKLLTFIPVAMGDLPCCTAFVNGYPNVLQTSLKLPLQPM